MGAVSAGPCQTPTLVQGCRVSSSRRAMAQIHYLPDGRNVESAAGETILSASLRAGIPQAHACGGNARCSTCRVMIVAGLEHCAQRNAQEEQLANRLRFGPQIRLA